MVWLAETGKKGCDSRGLGSGLSPLCYRKGIRPFYSILPLIGYLTVTGVTDEIGSPAKLVLSH